MGALQRALAWAGGRATGGNRCEYVELEEHAGLKMEAQACEAERGQAMDRERQDA